MHGSEVCLALAKIPSTLVQGEEYVHCSGLVRKLHPFIFITTLHASPEYHLLLFARNHIQGKQHSLLSIPLWSSRQVPNGTWRHKDSWPREDIYIGWASSLGVGSGIPPGGTLLWTVCQVPPWTLGRRSDVESTGWWVIIWGFFSHALWSALECWSGPCFGSPLRPRWEKFCQVPGTPGHTSWLLEAQEGKALLSHLCVPIVLVFTTSKGISFQILSCPKTNAKKITVVKSCRTSTTACPIFASTLDESSLTHWGASEVCIQQSIVCACVLACVHVCVHVHEIPFTSFILSHRQFWRKAQGRALFPPPGPQNNRRRSFTAEPDREIMHVALTRDPYRGFGKRAPAKAPGRGEVCAIFPLDFSMPLSCLSSPNLPFFFWWSVVFLLFKWSQQAMRMWVKVFL